MRTDALKWAASRATARDAVIFVLVSDRETAMNITNATFIRGRTLKSLQTYNSKITRMTLVRLVEEGLVEHVGFNYILKM